MQGNEGEEIKGKYQDMTGVRPNSKNGCFQSWYFGGVKTPGFRVVPTHSLPMEPEGPWAPLGAESPTGPTDLKPTDMFLQIRFGGWCKGKQKLWCVLPRDIRTLTFGQRMGLPLNREKLS